MSASPGPRLTYCGNVHPTEDLDAWLGCLRNQAAGVAAGAPRPFGLGLWWNAACAAELRARPERLEEVRQELAELELEAWTWNAFPFGGFHATRVKEAVYRPDWADPARAAYTSDVAAVAAELAPAGADVPISTLPLGFGAVDLPASAAALRRLAEELARLEDRTGVRVRLALEPEPFCTLESLAQAGVFLEQWVFARAAGGPRDETVLRRHLGVCVDLCHAFVVGEDPVQAMAGLSAQGIEVAKIQVSSCLELREPATALDALLAFDEPRYLHQTVASDGLRALDLEAVRARRAEFAAAERLRTHFHVPVYWDRAGALGSTRAEVERVLRMLESPYPLLEVETYTWSVVDGADFGVADLIAGIRAELDFVRRVLDESREPT